MQPQLSRGRARPRRGAGGLVVSRPSLKQVIPGSVPPWRAPCFAWPCRGFGLPGVFSWLCHGFLLPAGRNRGAASEVTSHSATARLNFSYYSSRCKNLLVKLFLFLQVETRSSGLLSQRALKASLMSAQLFASAFPLARNFATGRLPLVPHRCSLSAARTLLLLATFC